MPGQSKAEIRALLAGAGLAPRHRYGQNFLIDLNLMRKLVDTAEVCAEDVILEVGSGTGSLTELLLERGARVVAVEIDHGLQRLLRDRLGNHPLFTLIQADVLANKHNINPLVLNVLNEQVPEGGGAYKLVANLPYQIATPLLLDLLLVELPLKRLTCTIQKEVGERLAALSNTAAYGPISVICQTLADVELHAIMPASAFWPPPKVQSVMLTIQPKPAEVVEVADVPDFVSFVQQGFVQRRKMLRRLVRNMNLLDGLAAFHQAGINPDARPEQLTPSNWRAFHRALRARQSRE